MALWSTTSSGYHSDKQSMWFFTLTLLFFEIEILQGNIIEQRVLDLMKKAPLIDGHNDLAMELRRQHSNDLNKINLRNLTGTKTNIEKLQLGHVGAQFFSAYVLCAAQNKDAVRLTLEQIDVIKRMCHSYDEFEFVTSSEGINKSKKIACLIGIEGGHAIDSSLATLRMFYDLGVRYMTLTHMCNTPWAETSDDLYIYRNTYQRNISLTKFGEDVVKEMNRLGMMIDLSHTSVSTAEAVLNISKAPVIFSHSCASAICNISRNIPDDTLMKLKKNQGIVMVTFYPKFVCCCDTANVTSVADHFDHIKKIAGFESIGIGGDYDGVSSSPNGLEDVSKYPALIQELMRRNWNESELEAVLRKNILRVFKAVEKVRDDLISHPPSNAEIPGEEVRNQCRVDLKSIMPSVQPCKQCRNSAEDAAIRKETIIFIIFSCIICCMHF